METLFHNKPPKMASLFLNYCIHFIVPQTSWSTTEIYSLIVLEISNLRAGQWEDYIPCDGSREEFFLLISGFGGFPCFLSFLGMQLCHSSFCLYLHNLFSCVSVSLYLNLPLLSHRKIAVVGFRGYSNPVWSCPNWIISNPNWIISKIPIVSPK